MPIYEYECNRCGDFSALMPMAAHDDPCGCPECGASSARVTRSAPSLAAMSTGKRQAYARNEKSQHEPQLASQAAKKHGAGCNCCSGKKSSALLTAKGEKSFPSKRPWMISH